MLANVQNIWQRFLYRDSVLLEAKRQKSFFIKEEGWATEFSKLKEDDAFSTFIQVKMKKEHVLILRIIHHLPQVHNQIISSFDST